MQSTRKPSRQFAQDFVRVYFNHVRDILYIQTLMQGFAQQGINMEDFYWMEPGLDPSREELRQILSDSFYGFKGSEIEDLVKGVPDKVVSR